MKNLFFLVFILIIFTSCEENDYSKNETKTSLKNYSGRELFEGILLAKGNVANLLQPIRQSYSYYEINNIDDNYKKDFDNKANDILNFIESGNPYYFDNFKKSITSKNHIEIRETLTNSSQLIYNSALDLFLSKTEKVDLKNLLSQIDINTYTNENGIIDKEKLKKAITNSNSFSLNKTGKGSCWFAGVVLVAAAYVLVVHAAAAMTYVAVAWVAEAYAAVDKARTITRANLPNPHQEHEMIPVPVYEIEEEQLIEAIVDFT